jgi:predicted nucleic acid-binding protein
MTQTRRSAVFLDTNILVYASFPEAPFHLAARSRLTELESDGVLFWTSRQVLREYLASTTRPGAVVPPPTLEALSQAVRQFEAEFEIADEDAAVTALLLDLLKSRTVLGKQVHDANIVATMHRYKIPWLLTHNTADFTRFVPDIHLLRYFPEVKWHCRS